MIPPMQVYFPSTDTIVECSVRDLWVDFDGPHDSIQIRPFETSAQAIRRVYPGAIIFIGGLDVTPADAGKRVWWG